MSEIENAGYFFLALGVHHFHSQLPSQEETMSIRLVKDANAESIRCDRVERALNELQVRLRDLFRMRNEGAAYAKIAHLQGLVDGYMQALSGLGLVSDADLLALVAEVRRGADGPATGIVEPPTAFEITRASA